MNSSSCLLWYFWKGNGYVWKIRHASKRIIIILLCLTFQKCRTYPSKPQIQYQYHTNMYITESWEMVQNRIQYWKLHVCIYHLLRYWGMLWYKLPTFLFFNKMCFLLCHHLFVSTPSDTKNPNTFSLTLCCRPIKCVYVPSPSWVSKPYLPSTKPW